MNQGDIILIPFPYTDLSSSKTRPALVLSKNNHDDDLIVVGITSLQRNDAIRIENQNLAKGVLPLASFIRYQKVATLNRYLVRKVVAKLNQPTLNKVVNKFKALF